MTIKIKNGRTRKRCYCCGSEKKLDNFRPNPDKNDGLHNICDSCMENEYVLIKPHQRKARAYNKKTMANDRVEFCGDWLQDSTYC